MTQIKISTILLKDPIRFLNLWFLQITDRLPLVITTLMALKQVSPNIAANGEMLSKLVFFLTAIHSSPQKVVHIGSEFDPSHHNNFAPSNVAASGYRINPEPNF